MLSSSLTPLTVVFALFCLFASSSAQWQLTSLVSQLMGGVFAPQLNISLAFTLKHDSSQTACSQNWDRYPIPNAWTKCQDPLVRFRIAQFTDASNLTFEIVDIAQAQTTVNVTRTTVNITPNTPGFSCANFDSQCSLSSPLLLTTTESSFTPSPLEITYQLSRTDGINSGVTPCTEGWTFYITNPAVATLGPITLGRGTEKQWQTKCSTGWNCGGTDPSVGKWVGCQAPAFQFKKIVPTAGGDQISNFNISITHTFPLLMVSSIRGSNLPDYHLSDLLEAAGLQVKLILEDTQWKDGVTMSPIVGGGIDQTGDCGLGCEFSGALTGVRVVGVEVI